MAWNKVYEARTLRSYSSALVRYNYQRLSLSGVSRLAFVIAKLFQLLHVINLQSYYQI